MCERERERERERETETETETEMFVTCSNKVSKRLSQIHMRARARVCVCVFCARACERACVCVGQREGERGRKSSFDEHRCSFDLIYFERKRFLLITGEAQINLHYCYSRHAESQREDWLQTPSLGKKSTEREGERGTERD